MRMESISELQVPLIRIIDDNDVAVLHVDEPPPSQTSKYLSGEVPLHHTGGVGFMHTLDVPGQSYSAAQRRQDSYSSITSL
ncbi:hypothetical protein WDU94_012030 [Cyamophila willieti]